MTSTCEVEEVECEGMIPPVSLKNRNSLEHSKQEEIDEFEKVTISVEKSTIQNQVNNKSFHYRLFEDKDKIFQSRKTILERPCWRDDLVSLTFSKTADNYH